MITIEKQMKLFENCDPLQGLRSNIPIISLCSFNQSCCKELQKDFFPSDISHWQKLIFLVCFCQQFVPKKLKYFTDGNAPGINGKWKEIIIPNHARHLSTTSVKHSNQANWIQEEDNWKKKSTLLWFDPISRPNLKTKIYAWLNKT